MSNAELISRTPWQPCSVAGWTCSQLKHSFSVSLGKMLQSKTRSVTDLNVPYLKAQHVQWEGIRLSDLPRMWASPDEIETLEVARGDLLVCEGGEVGRAAIVSEKPPSQTIIQNALHLVRGRDDSEPRFLAYLLRHAATQQWFDVLCNRSTIRHFTVDKFREMWTWLPRSSTQRAIADYLDRETARLDALVAEKERVLALLAEKRRALITRTVTRGLDPNVPLRDSGIPWLGEIPAHWETCRLKFLSPQITVGIVVTPAKYYEVTGVPCLRSLNVREHGLSDADLVFISEKSNRLHSKSIIHVGDLVAVRSGQPGTTAVVDQRFDGANCIDLIIIRRSHCINSDFLAHFLNSDPAKMQFLAGSGGAIQQHFNIETAANLVLPLPSLGEQREIVAAVSKTTAEVNALSTATERTIALLGERRAALIAAAVTGQFDLVSAA